MNTNHPFLMALLASSAIAIALLTLPRFARSKSAPAPVAAAEVAKDEELSAGWRGVRHQERGEYKESAADFREALRRQPDLADVPINLAMVYEKLGKPCDAQRTLEALSKRYPEVKVVQDVIDLYDRARKGCTRAIPAKALRME